jgi:hypothetical protein
MSVLLIGSPTGSLDNQYQQALAMGSLEEFSSQERCLHEPVLTGMLPDIASSRKRDPMKATYVVEHRQRDPRIAEL